MTKIVIVGAADDANTGPPRQVLQERGGPSNQNRISAEYAARLLEPVPPEIAASLGGPGRKQLRRGHRSGNRLSRRPGRR